MMLRTLLTLAMAAAVITVRPPTPPIIIRADRDDAKYRALGKQFADVVVDINVPRRRDPARKGGNGVGVLIAPEWVLTAAHVATGIKERSAAGEHRVIIDGHEFVVAAIYIHPEWREEGPHDIALLKLKTRAVAAQYPALYASSDEAGKEIIVVGTGDTGTGLTGPVTEGAALRAATNRVEDVTTNDIVFDFDGPDSKDATELEGVSGPGDSGGPALISVNGRLYVIGVSVAQDGQGRGPGRYGAIEYYTRVSTHRAWLESLMK